MVTSSELLKEIADIFSTTVDRLKEKDRIDELIFPRKVFIYVCYNYLKMSGPAIAMKLNREKTSSKKELDMINRHIENNERKWLEYWTKYEKESNIWKQLLNNAA
jgi:chromosomal replication initiation ATPase DnaA